MRITLTLLFFFLFSGLYSQKVNNSFSDSRITCEYELENGKWNGEYVSKYTNGVVRSSGEFTNNVRSGIWTVYDSSGRKIHERKYSNHLSFQKLFPEKEKSGAASLFDSSFYSLKKNKDNYIEYFPLSERMVIYSSRIWRELKPENNKLLFDKKNLYQIIFPFVSDSLNETYCSTSEDFESKMSVEEIKKFNTKDYKIISWKLKEDVIFDNERNVSETRIIGICPVGLNIKTKDTTDLYWIYFPLIRKELAKHKVAEKSNASFDDFFFFRHFSSEIYKTSNVNNHQISDYCNTPEKIKIEQQRIEINLVEAEHEIWLGNLPY